MAQLRGRRVAITGGAQGIGKTIAVVSIVVSLAGLVFGVAKYVVK